MRWLALVLLLIAACKQEAPSRPPVRDADLAWHRVVLFGSDASEIAFLLGLPRAADDRGVVVSGSARAQGTVERRGTTVLVKFPIYDTTLVLEPAPPPHSYGGRYETASPAWGTGAMPLQSTPVSGPSLANQATLASGKPLDLGERRTVWRMRMAELAIKLVLDQRAAGEFDATMYFDNGNVTYFGGNGRGDRLLLAGFEGATPFSLDLSFDAKRKTATGVWRGGHLLGWKDTLTGERVADFTLDAKIALDGLRPMLHHPKLQDFDGHPLIVELAATWCSTCKNIAPTLRALHAEHADRGLKMVSLLYELTDDTAVNQNAEREFAKTHGVRWPVRAVPGELEDLVDVLPEGLSNVDPMGFPVVIFRRRDGTIAGVHSGFPAAATGTPHHATVEKFRALTAEILSR